MVDTEKIAEVLKLEEWFKILIFASGGILGFSLFFPTYGASNRSVILISLGTFLFSLGEWKQYKSFSAPGGGFGTLFRQTWKERRLDLLGLILNIVGLCLIFFGIWTLF